MLLFVGAAVAIGYFVGRISSILEHEHTRSVIVIAQLKRVSVEVEHCYIIGI